MKNRIIKLLADNSAGMTTHQILIALINACAHPSDAPTRGSVSKCITRLTQSGEITRVLYERRDGRIIYKVSATTNSVPDASASVAANP